MTIRCWTIAALLTLAIVLTPTLGAQEKKDDGFVPMFNGHDLSGWVNVNCAPGTFFVKDNEIITTGKPTGYLRTTRQYENFIAEFDWMHVNRKEVGNSGFFVWADPLPAVGTPYTRGIEVQVLVNLEKEGYYTSQGDLFSIWGATCKPDRPHPHGWQRCLPSERRCKGGGEWNHYKVVANNGTIKLHVNGKEVSGLSQCEPRKGYLALESEGAECHFRNLKIKELPSTHPRPDEVAEQAKGFKNLYTGLDLSGWETGAEGGRWEDGQAARRHWQPRDWVLHYDGKGAGKDRATTLSTAKEFGASEFIVDFRFPPTRGGNPASCTFVFRKGKDSSMRFAVDAVGVHARVASSADDNGVAAHFHDLKPSGEWNRLHATFKGKSFQVTINGKPIPAMNLKGLPAKGAFALDPGVEMDFANLFVRELK